MGKPGRPSRRKSQVVQEGGSIVVLQDPVQGAGKVVKDAGGRA